MKKVLFLMMLMCFLLPINVKAEESVTIYMFKGKTCIHCEQALEYISEHMDEIPKNVKINGINCRIYAKVGEKWKTEK